MGLVFVSRGGVMQRTSSAGPAYSTADCCGPQFIPITPIHIKWGPVIRIGSLSNSWIMYLLPFFSLSALSYLHIANNTGRPPTIPLTQLVENGFLRTASPQWTQKTSMQMQKQECRDGVINRGGRKMNRWWGKCLEFNFLWCLSVRSNAPMLVLRASLWSIDREWLNQGPCTSVGGLGQSIDKSGGSWLNHTIEWASSSRVAFVKTHPRRPSRRGRRIRERNSFLWYE